MEQTSSAAYPNIYVGPATEQYIDQKWLKSAATLKGKKAKDALAAEEPQLQKEAAFQSWSGEVQVYRAASTSNPPIPGGPVGLAPAFANLAPGKVLVYDEKGKTGGGGKINKIFRPYGFRPSKEGMDGDHVMERQLGGPDAINNLWPLPMGENRSSGSTVNTMEVTFAKTKMTVHKARERRKKKKMLYLLIKSVKTG